VHIKVSRWVSGVFTVDFFKCSTRINRSKYLGLCSFYLSFLILGFFPGRALIPTKGLALSTFFFSGLLFVLFFVCATLILFGIINLIILLIRRLHDFNYSGWWCLLIVVPIIGALFQIAVCCKKGTTGSNRFGEQPPPTLPIFYLLVLLAPLLYWLVCNLIYK
jgi:uncharacterized membrane protein YhaH (DUF805 family)